MRSAAYLYPWDVAGDPTAPELMAGLGLGHVVLAAVYHGIRAMTPRHPRHRVVTVPHSAAYYPSAFLDAGAWSFAEACTALRGAGLPVHAWTVFNHVDLPAPVADNVVNAYGDRYPWALCPARDAVLDRAVGIATEVADLPGISGIELEACGWFGFDHLGAHDKTSGVPPAARDLLSLCFCSACERSYEDAPALRRAVMAAWDGPVPPDVLRVRAAVADRFRAAVVGAIRSRRPDLEILLHTNPQPARSTAFTGADPARAASLVDGRVVNCWTDFAALDASLEVAGPVYASLLAVAGLGGRPLAGQVERATGAAGIRLYHAGLATNADLDAIRALHERGTSG
jgi:hypothetical protein